MEYIPSYLAKSVSEVANSAALISMYNFKLKNPSLPGDKLTGFVALMEDSIVFHIWESQNGTIEIDLEKKVLEHGMEKVLLQIGISIPGFISFSMMTKINDKRALMCKDIRNARESCRKDFDEDNKTHGSLDSVSYFEENGCEVIQHTLPLNNKLIDVLVLSDDESIAFHFAGYGDATTESGFGTPMLLDYYQGNLNFYVWSNINSEDPDVYQLKDHLFEERATL